MDDYINKIPSLKLNVEKYDDSTLESIEGEIELISWIDFQPRQGSYGAKSEGSNPSIYGLTVNSDSDQTKVLEFQFKAYNYLIKYQEAIKKSILGKLLEHYPSLQADYGYEGEEKDEYMPDITSEEDFTKLIGLSNIHLIDMDKDGTGYVGFEFGCEWDPEHGIGVMTYQNEVVEIGGADTSFTTWIAERHKDPERVNAEIEASYKKADEWHKEQNKKPWWKFW